MVSFNKFIYLLLVLPLLTFGCDQINIPSPSEPDVPEPEPVVQKSIVPDVGDPDAKPAEQITTPLNPGDVVSAFLAKQNYQRTNDDLGQLAGLSTGLDKIVELDLSNSPVTSVGLEHLQAFKSLKSLNLTKTRVGNPGLEVLSQVPQLQELNLTEVQTVNDAGMASLIQMPNLHSLTLTGSGVTDAAFTTLGEIPELKVLRVDGNPNMLGRQFTEAIQKNKFKSLEELAVRGSQFGYYGLQQIGKLKNLRILLTGKSNVTDASLKTIGMNQELRILDLSDSALTPVVFKQIIKLKKLEVLDLKDSQSMNDKVFQTIKGMKHLKLLNVNNTAVTEDAVKLLKEKFLTETVIMYNDKKY